MSCLASREVCDAVQSEGIDVVAFEADRSGQVAAVVERLEY